MVLSNYKAQIFCFVYADFSYKQFLAWRYDLLKVFAKFECYHRFGLKYSVEVNVYLQDIPVSIQNFRYNKDCSIVCS